ncbi:MAG: C_GCAxxG_C_C family protein [Spirochaetes bacterium]|nr:C_GCAxxG_C_C family protein [Spirochaetota bacterium]
MDIYEKVRELSLERLCCAQIIMKIGLEFLNKENPDLITAMKGLCLGTHTQKQCGAFSAAACMLSLFAGDQSPLLITELAEWFENKYQTATCSDIINADGYEISICSCLTAETCQYSFELLEKHGLMPEPELD